MASHGAAAEMGTIDPECLGKHCQLYLVHWFPGSCSLATFLLLIVRHGPPSAADVQRDRERIALPNFQPHLVHMQVNRNPAVQRLSMDCA